MRNTLIPFQRTEALLGLVKALTRLQERLARDTPDTQAGASERLLLFDPLSFFSFPLFTFAFLISSSAPLFPALSLLGSFVLNRLAFDKLLSHLSLLPSLLSLFHIHSYFEYGLFIHFFFLL